MRPRPPRRGVASVPVLLGLGLLGLVGTAAGWRETSAHYAARDAARALLATETQTILDWQERHPRQPCPASLTEAGGAAAAPRDPWGEPLVYRCPGLAGDSFELVSKGPDRLLGTGDDLSGWE